MPKLLYIVPARLPTEKAHGLQIVQNCEAFVDAGWTAELWFARRSNRARRDPDVYEYYGVKPNFVITHIPTLDLMPLAHRRRPFERIAHYVILVSFSVAMLCRAAFARADVYYTRDPFVVLSLSILKRRSSLAYEVHALASSRLGMMLQRAAISRARSNFTISERLASDLVAGGADVETIFLARDAVREARFADPPERVPARLDVGWPVDAFIVGYLGRLQTLGIDKGVGTLLRAVGRLPGASLAIVGGPDDMAEELRREWRRLGLDESRFLYAGHVAPHRVPAYLSALDVCAMPHPPASYFKFHMSPLKLFEYMASGRPIVASELPAICEILEDGETALLFPAGDIDALVRALERLQHDEDLRETLATNAYAQVMQNHTWAKRAEMILERVQRR